ncbi:hypothetical protein C8Q77DRAFT_1052042 [Trametes polyzona]|nr:hypothetical protein C8Q77DRAFT_1052042 [Trametes polyzona]
MPFCDLNHDVLSYIANYLHRSDISALTKTCGLLHDSLLHLLVRGRVGLRKRNFYSFYTFMRQEARRSLLLSPHLQSLVFYTINERGGDLTFAEATSVVMRVLQLSSHLTSLTIHSADLLFTPRELHDSLALLPCLEELAVDTLTSMYQDVLVGIAPRLRTVHLRPLHGCGPGGPQRSRAHMMDPISFLCTHRTSITSLSVSLARLPAYSPPLANLRQLSISCLWLSTADYESGWLPPLVRLFPNVERLEVLTLIEPSSSPRQKELATLGEVPVRTADAWYAKAKAWQARHGTWTNGLRYLCTRLLLDVYQLGPSCHISHIHVDSTYGTRSMYDAVLSDTRPRKVSLTVGSTADFDRDIPSLLAAISHTPSLTHITLRLAHEFDPGATLPKIGEQLRASSISHLALHIDPKNVPSRALMYQTSIVQAIPSLRMLFFDFTFRRIKAWERVETAQGEVRWEQLPAARAREVMSAEDMVVQG